ncbi:serine protease [Streptacidiphilus jiangxiensis]|uniref:serine protease n=1 Tax=Streptacidiphilus jiangxiensis TaxID=235985 RepID=UPI0011604471|nr:serine protease [Streptacidiphilus jiangxiensis]
MTAHEVVDGLASVLLAYPDGSSLRVRADGIVPLPAQGLALLRAAVPPGGPWALADGAGTRLVAVPGPGGALQGAVTGLVTARYEASERFWLVPDVWQLGLEQAPYGLPVQAAGGPVVDAETGAAVGVATAALRSRRRGAVLAVRLGAVAAEPVLADLLARNAETVPAHGRALNPAGVLELTAAGIDPAATEAVARRVPRADGLVEAARGWDPVRPVLAVVGESGSGRTTELAALALHRTRAAYRLPTLWLRGADLAAGDASVLDAADRALARVHTLLRHPAPPPLAGQVARVAATVRRPLLVVLDAPEEAPPQLLARWRGWCTETVRRLRGTECRLLVGCLPEFWEGMGAALDPDDVQGCHLLGPLDPGAARTLALQGGAAVEGRPEPGVAALVATGDPVALRLLGEVRAAQPVLALPRARTLTRPELLQAGLDLACLRIAERLAAPAPGALRRLAVRVAGRCHEAARRMLGAPDGGLTVGEFDELFPWAEGWAQAVLGEGLFVAAGTGYRFASGALADRLQGFHLDLPAALTMILADGSGAGEGPASRPIGAHRRGGPVGWAPPVPVAGRPQGGGVPRWRSPVVRQALLELGESDPPALESLLSRLVLRLDGPDAAAPGTDAHWWARRLLTETLERLPDAAAYAPLLRALAARIVYAANTGPVLFREPGPAVPWDFWRRLPLTVEARLDVLRVLARAGVEEPGRLLGELIGQDPGAVLPPLCRWLADEAVSGVAAEMLFAHRHVALDELVEGLVDVAHPGADALLRALAEREPSALCRAVDRWAHDPRPERHVAAATVLPLVARHAAEGAPAERTLVRLAAEALLGRADEEALHGAAYSALVRDPVGRARHLRGAVTRYLAGDPLLGAAALAPALDSHPALVLSGYAGRLHEPGEEAAAVLRALGGTPAPHARAAAARLVREYLQRRPEAAAQVGGWLRARLDHGAGERETLLAFVRDVAVEQPEAVRRRVADALTGAGTPLAAELTAQLTVRPAGQPAAQLTPDGTAVTSPMRIGDQAHGKV